MMMLAKNLQIRFSLIKCDISKNFEYFSIFTFVLAHIWCKFDFDTIS